MIYVWLLAIVVTCVWIMKACDPFESAADYLGRNMQAGIKGATINAAASSIPELLTTCIFLFFYHDKAGFSAGIGTTAGSAVFNAMVIPGACIMAAMIFLKVRNFELSRACILRDGFFLLLAEITLIVILSNTKLEWYHGFILLAIYIVYAIFMIKQNAALSDGADDDDDEDDDENDEPYIDSLIINFLKFNYRDMFHKRDEEYTTTTAFASLGLAILHISLACYLLAEAVVNIGEILQINTFFIAVILAAAATSVPDTVISIRDAMKGNYDDSIANAVGSNIFDICICLGVPLLIYTIFYGAIDIPQSAGVAELRIILLFLSISVIVALLLPKVGYATAGFFISGYLFYVVYSFSRGKGYAWAETLGNMITTFYQYLC